MYLSFKYSSFLIFSPDKENLELKKPKSSSDLLLKSLRLKTIPINLKSIKIKKTSSALITYILQKQTKKPKYVVSNNNYSWLSILKTEIRKFTRIRRSYLRVFQSKYQLKKLIYRKRLREPSIHYHMRPVNFFSKKFTRYINEKKKLSFFQVSSQKNLIYDIKDSSLSFPYFSSKHASTGKFFYKNFTKRRSKSIHFQEKGNKPFFNNILIKKKNNSVPVSKLFLNYIRPLNTIRIKYLKKKYLKKLNKSNFHNINKVSLSLSKFEKYERYSRIKYPQKSFDFKGYFWKNISLRNSKRYKDNQLPYINTFKERYRWFYMKSTFSSNFKTTLSPDFGSYRTFQNSMFFKRSNLLFKQIVVKKKRRNNFYVALLGIFIKFNLHNA